MRTHYDNLHVSEKASPEVIRGAYKALAQKWHPDKHPDQREKAERYFKIITRAFDILSDPKLRVEYDAWLVAQRSAEPGQPKAEPVKDAGAQQRRKDESNDRQDDQLKRSQTTKLASKTALLGRLWRGEEGLGKTFWLYGVIGVNVVGLVAFAVLSASAYFVHGNFDTASLRTTMQASAIYWIYAVFILISIWRSSGKIRPLTWPALASRAICLAPPVAFVSIFVMTAFEVTNSQPPNLAPSTAAQPQQPGLFDDLDSLKSQATAPQPPALTADEIHFQKIYAAHPDADSVAADQRFKQWVDWSADRQKIYENGTADEVIQLLSSHKQRIVDFTEEFDSYLASAYAMYPGLNFEGQNPNMPAIEEVVKFRDQYIANGSSNVEALQMAVNAVAIKRRWMHPADSFKQ